MKTGYKRKLSWHFAFIAALLLVGVSNSFAQTFYTQFGKNRVQFNDFTWSFYESKNFVVYFYQGGQQYGEYSIYAAEKNLPGIQTQLEYYLDRKIEILVFHNIADLNQTNIGNKYENTEAFSSGRTQVINNKVFVYYNGNHGHLEKQIREGIAKAYVANMLFGDNVQEVVQNAFLLNLPNWFKEGLIAYIGQGWSPELDSRLRDLILTKGFKNFNRLKNDEAIFAGHAFWYYLSQNYNKSAIPNLLHLTRVERSLERGFIYVIGQTLQNTVDEWVDYNNSIYAIDENKRATFNDSLSVVKDKKLQRQITKLAINKKGNLLSYAINKSGRYKIFIKDVENNEKKKVLAGGIATFEMPVNVNYPLMAWSKKSNRLAVVYQKRDNLFLLKYDADTNEKTVDEITKFQQVLGIDFTDDDKTLIFSAIRAGQCDLFTYYTPTTRVKQITNDYFDDLQPAFYKDEERKGILFSSNRLNDTLRTQKQDTILPSGQYDLFFYDLIENKSIATRLYSSPKANEWQVQPYQNNSITFLSDQNGIYNQFVGSFKEVFVRNDTVITFKDSTTVTNPATNIDSLLAINEVIKVNTEPVYKPAIVPKTLSNYNRNISLLSTSEKVAMAYTFDGVEHISILPKKQNVNNLKNKKLNNTPFKQQFINQLNESEAKAINKTTTIKKNKKPKEKKPLKEDETLKSVEEKPEILEETIEEIDEMVEDETEEFEEEIITIEMESINEEEEKPAKEKKESFFFESQFNRKKKRKEKKEKASEAPEIVIEFENIEDENKPLFISTKIRPYVPKFSVEKITAQLDNSLMFTNYQFLGNQQENFIAEPPALNSLIRYSVSDVMENYRLIGGFRFPFSFNGMEWSLTYQNNKKRLDKQIIYYRNGGLDFVNNNNNTSRARKRTTFVEGRLVYPFDFAQSIRGYFGWRNEKASILSTEISSLTAPDVIDNYAYAKLEYVYDDSRQIALNIKNGTRGKAFVEAYHPFEGVVNDSELKFNIPKNSLMAVAGIDLRHYQPLFRKAIFAARFYGGTSFGNKRMLYRLGGLENWITFNQNNKIDFSTLQQPQYDYAFANNVSNLRGYKINARNGNSIMLVNAEVRIPVVTTLFNRSFKSDILNSLQIVPFFDFGTAWIGVNPFKPDVFSVQNTFPVPEPGVPPGFNPVTITVDYFRNPLIAGYGVGFRTQLFGYFVKYDIAKALDYGTTPGGTINYLSFGYDF